MNFHDFSPNLTVVLYTSGSVVHSEAADVSLHYSDAWYDCDDENKWKDFDGEITLKNDQVSVGI
jgi:hypothetical protein